MKENKMIAILREFIFIILILQTSSNRNKKK
jgi:hypothetical protein